MVQELLGHKLALWWSRIQIKYFYYLYNLVRECRATSILTPRTPPSPLLIFFHRSLSLRGVQRCVWVSVWVREPELQEPCRTPGTSTRMPSSRASVQRSWRGWRMSCRSWTPRYREALDLSLPARWSASDCFLQGFGGHIWWPEVHKSCRFLFLEVVRRSLLTWGGAY